MANKWIIITIGSIIVFNMLPFFFGSLVTLLNDANVQSFTLATSLFQLAPIAVPVGILLWLLKKGGINTGGTSI